MRAELYDATCSRNICGLYVLILDFLLQNGLMFIYFYYYYTQDFFNDSLRKAYFAFLIIYVIISTLPRFLVITFERTFDNYNRT